MLRAIWTSGRTQPAGRNFCWGITPAHLAATALQSAGMAHLAYVVEGHASACPQTVGVGTLCGVVQMTTEERHGKVVCMMIKVEDIKIKTIIIFEKKKCYSVVNWKRSSHVYVVKLVRITNFGWQSFGKRTFPEKGMDVPYECTQRHRKFKKTKTCE